ncbi:MAG: hypothetical protein LBU32_27375 [Clostridiales bacterium]|nr:hypothetical protein [Clostridiales bacterium]
MHRRSGAYAQAQDIAGTCCGRKKLGTAEQAEAEFQERAIVRGAAFMGAVRKEPGCRRE